MKIQAFFFLLFISTGCETQPSLSAFEQGNAHAATGDLMKAKAAYETALLEAPTQLEVYRNLGIVEFRLGMFSTASIHLQYALAHGPRDGEASFFLAEIFRAEEKLPEAISLYQKTLLAMPQHMPALQALAWCQLESRQPEAALHTILQARRVAPQDLENVLILAQIWIHQRQEEKALALLDSVHTKDFPPDIEALWSSTRGKAQLSFQAYLPAYHSFREALLKAPLLASALLGIGQTYLHFGQQKDAQEYLEQAIHVNPKLTEGYYLLGTLLQTSDPANAKKYLEIFCQRAAPNPTYTTQFASAQAWLRRQQN